MNVLWISTSALAGNSDKLVEIADQDPLQCRKTTWFTGIADSREDIVAVFCLRIERRRERQLGTRAKVDKRRYQRGRANVHCESQIRDGG
jgi:hypothetical protein